MLTPREEWSDADFDLPDGVPIHAPDDKDDQDEDWDLALDIHPSPPIHRVSQPHPVPLFTIRPPLSLPDVDDDEDEGVSTVKLHENSSTLKSSVLNPQPLPLTGSTSFDDDFEDAFALPSDLTQLSLARRSSKHSLEWGEKDHTSSSQSSDAYSSLGFADTSPSSNSTSAASSICLRDSESELDDVDEDLLDGLIIPNAIFDSGHAGEKLTKILDNRKKAHLAADSLKVATPDPEDDFEAGLVIEDDVDLSPSRLLGKAKNPHQRLFSRSSSIPPTRPSSLLRPPSSRLLKSERAKSPSNPPPSSARQFQKLRLSPSPPLRPPSRSQTLQTFQTFSAAVTPPSPSPSSTFLTPKPGSLRAQKSHTGLKPSSPPPSTRKPTRKASLSSLIDPPPGASSSSKAARYEEPTAASRAKSHKSSTSRMHDFKVPPTRPSTPSSNTAALRLTMPTQSRLKSRPALSQVFGAPVAPSAPTPISRATSPIPPRPPSSLSLRSTRPPSIPLPPAVPRILRKPKRLRTYGDGTELDEIEDLPADREKEARFRVQPKGYGNRVPGATYASKVAEKSNDKGTLRRKAPLRDDPPNALPSATSTLRRVATRIEFPSKPSSPPQTLPKKKKADASVAALGHTRRKPTLIRNLGGAGGPKVIGDMKWNPQTLRWEGNDQVLRDFDAVVGTSTRPALITHLTGSSMGSPVGSFASGARIVGCMMFDPSKMCWISTLPPDEDEPDVFANLADDEDDSDCWDGTIRACQPSASVSASANSSTSLDPRLDAPSPAHSHSRTVSESGSERGSRASMVMCEVNDDFVEKCRLAEQRHLLEIKGWKSALAKHAAPDRSYLYEIRALATRKY